MASVHLNRRDQAWYVKWRNADGWQSKRLGKHPVPFPPSRPPKKCPDDLLKRAEEYFERERMWRDGREPGKKTPLAGYLATFMDSFAATHPDGTAKAFGRVARRFGEFCKARGIATVQAVTRQTVRDWLESRLKAVKANSVVTDRKALHAIFARAEQDGLIAANPARGVKPPGKPDPSPPTFWTREQVQAIADACEGWHRDMVLILANTGLRIAAALAMEWAWIDGGQGLITVPRSSDKGGKGYSVPLTATAKAVLDRRRAESTGPLVFPGRTGKPYDPSSFATALNRATVKAGVPRGNPHDLRHTFARLLILDGTPITVVQAILGHSSVTMTQRYTSFGTDQAAAWLQSFSVGQAPHGSGRQDDRPGPPAGPSPGAPSGDP